MGEYAGRLSSRNNDLPIDSPVVIIVFNRPEKTKMLLDALKASKPKKLYIVADGPRQSVPNDAEKCAAVLEQFAGVDWDCELIFDISPSNLGCRERVVSGLNWVFSLEPKAIILEDDCIPNEAFIPFANAMLNIYEGSSSVGMVSGNHYGYPISNGNNNHYLTKFPHIWGWATWADKWSLFDKNLTAWDHTSVATVSWATKNPFAMRHWTSRFEAAKEDVTVWDAQWVCSLWIHQLYSVGPNANLVTNVGFGLESTHSTVDSLFEAWPTALIPTSTSSSRSPKFKYFVQVQESTLYRLEALLSWLETGTLGSKIAKIARRAFIVARDAAYKKLQIRSDN